RSLGDLGQDRHPGRPLERGEAIGAVRGEFSGRGLALEHDDDTDLFSVLLVRHGVGRRLGDRGMAEQHILYLVWRDLLPGPVDQLLEPADQGEVAVRAERTDVAGAEPAVPERGARRDRIVEVLVDDGRAAHRYLALLAGRHRLPVVVEDGDLGTGRLPDRPRAAFAGRQRI